MEKFITLSPINIITDVFNQMKARLNIVNIVDNANDTYSVTTDRIGIVKNWFVVKIENTPNFNGEFVVNGISGNTFLIKKQSGSGISTFGQIFPINPILYFEKFAGAKNEIYQQTIDYVSSAKQFPCGLLLLDIPMKFERPETIIPELNIYFFEQTDPTKNSAWRFNNTFPKLQSYYESFIENLETHQKVIDGFTHEKTDLYYLGTGEKNQNKIGIVDAVLITINNLKLINSIC
jgi:hypothetical protein